MTIECLKLAKDAISFYILFIQRYLKSKQTCMTYKNIKRKTEFKKKKMKSPFKGGKWLLEIFIKKQLIRHIFKAAPIFSNIGFQLQIF